MVALVVAEDLRSAQRALEKVRVEYEPLPPVMPWKLSLRARRFSTRARHRTCFLKTATWGDIDEGFRQADRVFEESYTSPSMFHHPMEHVGGCLAQQRRA